MSQEQTYITSFCSLQSGQVNINHSLAFSEEKIASPASSAEAIANEGSSAEALPKERASSAEALPKERASSAEALAKEDSDFLKSVYKHYQLNYPKFYKMDNLCKLAFITSELILKNNPLSEKYKAEDIAIVISNSASSMDIDQEHQRTISDKNNYFPSPSAFVYTLPNILIAEIAIKNSIKGENAFFIFDTFDSTFMSEYVNSLINTGKATCCIAGWVDFYEGNYHAFLYTVEKQPGILNRKHAPKELEKLFLHQS